LKNYLKEKARQGKTIAGILTGLGHSDVSELLSRVGYDFLYLDDEHGPMHYETLQRMMQAMNGTDCTPIVRVQENNATDIKRLLDIGAHGIVVPMVNSREDAERAVMACRYPPQGIRGYGPRRYSFIDPNYLKTANDEIMVIAIIETGKAIDNVEDILAVDGIDAGLVGHFDLSFDMGLPIPPVLPPGQDNPRLAKALEKVIQASRKTGKPVGLAVNPANIEWTLEQGFTFNIVAFVDNLLFEGACNALDIARRAGDRK
jgi:2-keto-3-deoxy-L-rhamnonate aldolase RhmA